jgi:hypothetical protein
VRRLLGFASVWKEAARLAFETQTRNEKIASGFRPERRG